jgi:alpha-tubulin suppressor-like RCC1 family protein
MKRIIQFLSLCMLVWACSKSATSPKDGVAGCSSETQNQDCGSVAGSVVSSDGKPVEGATVEVYLKDGTILKKTSSVSVADSSRGSDKTDASGKYLIDKLPGAEYTLKVVKDDSLGAAQEFSLAKGEEKTLPPITIINNGIIIGKVDRSIVQQAENAYAVINEIGQQTNISKAGDFTFNNVPTTINNTYTINIVNKDGTPYVDKNGKPVVSGLENLAVTVKSGEVVQVDTAGVFVVNNPILKAEVPISASVAKSLGALKGGTLLATLVSGSAKVVVEVDVENGKTPLLPIQAIDGSKEWIVVLQGLDSTGTVIYEGTDTVDLSKEKIESLNIHFARKVATLIVKETVSDSVFAAIAKTRRLILSGPGLDSMMASATRTTGSLFKTDSAAVGKGLIVTMQYLDADGKVTYQGSDTVDVTGNGKDTAEVTVRRLAGSISLKGKFVDDAGKDLTGLKFDTAYAVVYGAYMDSLKVQLVPKETGEFSATFSKVPAGDKRYLIITARSGKGERSYSIKDSLAIGAGKDTVWDKTVKSAPTIPVFSIKDYEIEVGDTVAAELEWTPKAPDGAVVTLTSLNLAVSRTSGGKFWGLSIGTTKIVSSVQGYAQKDTFDLSVIAAKVELSMKLDTNAFEIAQGGDGHTKVRLTRRKLSAAITFSAPNPPAGVTVAFTPATTVGDTSTIVVTATTSTFPGNYKFGVIARTSGVPDRVDSISLKVTRDKSMEWVKLTAGYDHSCAINSNDDAYCWGQNSAGQIGNGNTTNQIRPTLVAGGFKWSMISAGYNSSCGITKDGEGYCWGVGNAGQLGNGGTANSSVPVPISVSGGDRWADIDAGGATVCGVTTDGRGFCFGSNTSGQLGDGTTVAKSVRTLIPGTRIWKKIRLGWKSWNNQWTTNLVTTCGMTTSNEIFCWGDNAAGQLGDGNPGESANSSPIKLLAAKEWKDLEVGEGHVCAITASNDGYCWGWNPNGQVGIGSMVDQSTPSLVLNDIKWTKIGLGKSSSCGINTVGKGYCWGLNGNGQAGNGVTSPSQTTPAAVLGNTKWLDIAPGFGMACGINEFNQTYCWGSGNLGAGNTTSSLIPWRVSEPLAP